MCLRYAEHLNRFGWYAEASMIVDTMRKHLDSNDYSLWIGVNKVKMQSHAFRSQLDSFEFFMAKADSLILLRYSEDRVVVQEEGHQIRNRKERSRHLPFRGRSKKLSVKASSSFALRHSIASDRLADISQAQEGTGAICSS